MGALCNEINYLAISLYLFISFLFDKFSFSRKITKGNSKLDFVVFGQIYLYFRNVSGVNFRHLFID